jgi:DNA-binding Lrp family transcriptional regulator
LTLSGFVVFIFNGTLDNCQEIFRNVTNNLILFSMQDKIYFMKDHLTVKQKKVACVIQKDIVVMRFPFNELGNLCGLTNEDVLDTTKQLFKKGFIRKYGAILRHQKAGYEKNALVVWSVPADQIEKAGKIFASFLFVSHCYERNPAFIKKYNIFTMLHSKDENILSLIKNMATATDINDYIILESIQEYKKISPEYFR